MSIRRFRRDARCWMGVFIGFILLLSGMVASPGAAQDYPTRPITINVGFPPGSGAGIGSQLFADHARKYLPKPQPILINYKPGAASAIAADFVLKQPPDGYNLLWVLPDLMAKLVQDGNQLSFKKEDFAYIGTIGVSPCLVTVNKEGPYKKFEDLMDAAKKSPGKLSYGSAGIASGNHLSAEILMMKSGIRLNHVPFAGGAQAITALLGGHIDCFIGGSVAAHSTHIKPGGGLTPLIVMSRERWPEFPDVPTCLEKGYEIDRTVWFSLAAAKGTPQTILDFWQKVFRQTVADPEVKTALLKMGYLPGNWGPEETRKKADEEFEMAKEIFTKLGLIK
jgi:tripartite-type tricarboxylate transporter receptor subunit TctC